MILLIGGDQIIPIRLELEPPERRVNDRLHGLAKFLGNFAERISLQHCVGMVRGKLEGQCAFLPPIVDQGISLILLVNTTYVLGVSTRNIRLNKCENKVQVEQVNLLENMPDINQFDLVIANLYKGLLVQLFSDNNFWQSNYYMISGFIPSMKAELLTALPTAQLKILMEGQKEQWRLWLMENIS